MSRYSWVSYIIDSRGLFHASIKVHKNHENGFKYLQEFYKDFENVEITQNLYNILTITASTFKLSGYKKHCLKRVTII